MVTRQLWQLRNHVTMLVDKCLKLVKDFARSFELQCMCNQMVLPLMKCTVFSEFKENGEYC